MDDGWLDGEIKVYRSSITTAKDSRKLQNAG